MDAAACNLGAEKGVCQLRPLRFWVGDDGGAYCEQMNMVLQSSPVIPDLRPFRCTFIAKDAVVRLIASNYLSRKGPQARRHLARDRRDLGDRFLRPVPQFAGTLGDLVRQRRSRLLAVGAVQRIRPGVTGTRGGSGPEVEPGRDSIGPVAGGARAGAR